MKSIILSLMLCMLLFSFASANLPHQQNTDLNFSVTSNFATSCTLKNINTPDGIITINQTDTSTGTFDFSVLAGNYSSLGTYCHNIVCTDGTDTTSGEVCREVSPSGQAGNANTVFFIFVILLIYGITFIGFFNKNAPITILGGMAMIFLGVYMFNHGIIVYQDTLTNYISYLTIGIGFVLSIWALWEEYLSNF